MVAKRINDGDFFTAETEVRTLPGGSKNPSSKSPGEIDLRVHGSTMENALIDLKPVGGKEDTGPQTENYARYDKTVFSSKPNTRPLTDFAPNALDPVETGNKTYLLQQGKSPERLEYYRYDKVTARTEEEVATITQRSKPNTPTPTTIAGATPELAGGVGERVASAAKTLGLAVVPGATEGVVATEAVGLTAARVGMPRLAAAALSGAKAPGRQSLAASSELPPATSQKA